MPTRKDSQFRLPFVILFFGVGTILGLFSAIVLDVGTIGLFIGAIIGLALATVYLLVDIKRHS